MTIGIFAHPYGEKHPAGLERFVRAATAALIAASPEHSFIIYSKQPVNDIGMYPAERCQFVSYGYSWFWIDRTVLRAPKSDCYIFWTPVAPFLFTPGKSIVCVLDFSYLALPKHGLRDAFKRRVLRFVHGRAIRNATQVIAISHATKDEITEHHLRPGRAVSVIYPGYTQLPFATHDKELADSPYILYVGAIKERKNVTGIISGFARVASDFPSLTLRIAGHGGGVYARQCEDLAKSLGVVHRVQFLGQVTDAALGGLYRGAAMLAYPSIVEGFGFPILEAMSLGVPVITSASGALKEIAGNAAVLVDPYDDAAIASGMRKILTDTQLKNQLIESGKARARNFSWEQFATSLRAVINAL